MCYIEVFLYVLTVYYKGFCYTTTRWCFNICLLGFLYIVLTLFLCYSYIVLIEYSIVYRVLNKCTILGCDMYVISV